MGSKDLFSGLLVGAAIGVGAGILLAPAKGKKTQKSLLDGAHKLTDELKENVSESMSYLENRQDTEGEEVSKKDAEEIGQKRKRTRINQ